MTNVDIDTRLIELFSHLLNDYGTKAITQQEIKDFYVDNGYVPDFTSKKSKVLLKRDIEMLESFGFLENDPQEPDQYCITEKLRPILAKLDGTTDGLTINQLTTFAIALAKVAKDNPVKKEELNEVVITHPSIGMPILFAQQIRAESAFQELWEYIHTSCGSPRAVAGEDRISQ